MPKLLAYVMDGHAVHIRPAPLERDWMDATDQRFAYRCLPLNIANAHGWELLCPAGFSAQWSGLNAKEAVQVEPDVSNYAPALGHFGHGVLTFHVPCLFRTDPGFDLFVTGPINRPKDAIAPLSGIVETDWSSYTFTMNWLFTRPNTKIRFEQGEPYCHLFPVERGVLERIEPQVSVLSKAPDLEREHKLWSESRSTFNADLQRPESEAVQQRWQKGYFRGLDPSGRETPAEHRSRLRLKNFVVKE
ncbi:hypothetical protein ACVILL_003766 [Bradyrhizobium sp. USDA 3364]